MLTQIHNSVYFTFCSFITLKQHIFHLPQNKTNADKLKRTSKRVLREKHIQRKTFLAYVHGLNEFLSVTIKVTYMSRFANIQHFAVTANSSYMALQ